MRFERSDVVVVGGGGAGLRAAIACSEVGAKLDIALVSKVYPMRSHTVAAEGGAAAVVSDEDSLDDHFRDTVSGGDWLVDQDAVDLFVRDAPRALAELERWGCPWSRREDGRVAVRPFGGMKRERTWYAADKTGFHMLHTLFQTSLKFPAIKRYDEFLVVDLLVDDGRCRGVVALEMKTGEAVVIAAPAVILATGGAGRAFPFTTNGGINTGDGMAMAYRAGVALKDMEFIQYHPTGLPRTGILITEGARGEGGFLLNKNGYRYLQDYNLGPPEPSPRKKAMELGPRDRLSQAFWHEQRKGRTVDHPDGDVVMLDLRHLGKQRIDERLPLVRELARLYAGVDPVEEPIPVRPVVHYTMGGIDTDAEGGSAIQGLFAAGECACISINGANRLGSNSLTELLVFGRRAGIAAAEESARQEAIHDDEHLQSIAEAAMRRVTRLLEAPAGKEDTVTLRQELHEAMDGCAGIYREEQPLKAACKKIHELRERYRRLGVADKSGHFNTELAYALELGAMLDVGEAIVHSALERRESRGAHQRIDHPERDDSRPPRHTLAFHHENDAPMIDYRPVVITRWEPGERVYGGEIHD